MGVLDLSSNSVLSMIKEQFGQEKYQEIIQYASLPDVELTEYVQELIAALCHSKLATISLRRTLYQVGFKETFNLILDQDAGFIETTVRHL